MASRMETLLNAVKRAKSTAGGDKEDKNFYYPERDSAGNASVVIRFLPGKTDDDIPFVKTYAHGFKGPTGKWLIEDCPTTINQPCFVCEKNGVLWNTGIKANQDIVRERKRKISYVSNILVIEDKKSPENEGKIFLFKFGTKIFNKIADKIEPEFEDETPCNIFDLETGANFKFKIRKVEGQTNYDKSEFSDSSKIEINIETAENLDQFTDPKRYKSSEDLEKRFNIAVGNVDRMAEKEELVKEESTKEVKKSEELKPSKVEDAEEEIEEDAVLELMRQLAEAD